MLFLVLPGDLLAEPQLEKFFAQNCVKCHGPEKQKGKVRLDHPVDVLFADGELLETVASMLESGDMPPEKAPQPKAEARAKALQLLQKRILANRPANTLRRLTRSEYTYTLSDLFGVEFDLTGLLPPDQVESGFDKFGEGQLMSPHQVMAYLKTARFVAERLLPDAKPELGQWEFDARHFHGSGRGDYREGDGFLLSAFRQWRSNVHFSTRPDAYERFKIPAFGRYRFEVNAHSVNSKEGEIIGINLGDGRYPVSFRGIRRVPMPHGSRGFTVELTLKAGDEVSFTFDSGRVQSTGDKPRKHKGAKMRFTHVKVTGPIIGQWPTAAMRAILPGPDMKPTELVDHLALLLTQRPLSAADRAGFAEIVSRRQKAGDPPVGGARSVLIALLTSPHFIYKAESPQLTDVELAHRLSYFLWNSVPDARLLAIARAGALG